MDGRDKGKGRGGKGERGRRERGKRERNGGNRGMIATGNFLGPGCTTLLEANVFNLFANVNITSYHIVNSNTERGIT